jgi:hypothetical protein
MTIPVRPQYINQTITFLVFASIATTLLAQPVEVPLARTTDLEFSVEYSAEELMLGDMLFARTTIRNISNRTVKVTKTNLLDIQAKSPFVTELVYSGDFGGSGGSLLELAPQSELSDTYLLDMFGNDGKEDGAFSPFNADLKGLTVVLHANRLVASDVHLDGQDYRDFLLEHKHEIKLGAPIVDKDLFDRSMATELERQDLKPNELYFHDLQNSYLFTLSMDPHKRNSDPRAEAAIAHVLAQKLPKNSSTRRAAAIFLQADQLIKADAESEEQATSKLISLLSEGPAMERSYWRRILLGQFNRSEAGFVDKYIVPKKKYLRIVQRFDDAGIRGQHTKTDYLDYYLDYEHWGSDEQK